MGWLDEMERRIRSTEAPLATELRKAPKQETPEAAEKRRAYGRQRAIIRYEERKAAGVCVRCSKPRAENSSNLCARHRAEINADTLARYHAKKAKRGAVARLRGGR